MGTKCNSHFAVCDSQMKVKGKMVFVRMEASHSEDLNIYLGTKYVALPGVPTLCTFQ